MNHKYTKKQIIESIKYWKWVLKTLCESKSALLDAFAEKFGEDVVFGLKEKERIFPTIDMFNDIYSIANDIIFDSQLTLRLIKDTNTLTNLNFASYVYADVKIKGTGKRTFIDHEYKASNGITYFPPYIEISNFVFHVKMPFMYMASFMIHEMIHQYTVEHSNEIQLKYEDKANSKDHNPHGSEFKKMMNEINDAYGTSISIACDINNIKAEFDKAIEASRKMLESDAEKRNIIYQNKYMIIEKPSEEDIYVTHLF